MQLSDRTAVITGASSGIGAACAKAFAGAGARLVLAARRVERLEAVRDELTGLGAPGVHCIGLDVRDDAAVSRAFDALPAEFSAVDVLVNNAGLSRGIAPLHEGLRDDWNEMIDTNIKGLLSVDRVLVPKMVERASGTVIHLGSIAGHQAYPGGNVYCATKHAVRALTDGLRQDLLGTGVRVLSVDPGMVDTEFSEVRFHGDRQRAEGVYAGMQPLLAADVADVVLFAASRPPHVNLAQVLLLPTDQASATQIHRKI
jgi:3-hydroxy acid dehydrogenase/malonic semialdehyde reductase